jgi:hypothetical protein
MALSVLVVATLIALQVTYASPRVIGSPTVSSEELNDEYCRPCDHPYDFHQYMPLHFIDVNGTVEVICCPYRSRRPTAGTSSATPPLTSTTTNEEEEDEYQDQEYIFAGPLPIASAGGGREDGIKAAGSRGCVGANCARVA